MICAWIGGFGRRGRHDGLPPCGAIHPPFSGFVEIFRGGWINRRLIRHCGVMVVRGLAFDLRVIRGFGRWDRHDGLPPCGAIHPPSYGLVWGARRGFNIKSFLRCLNFAQLPRSIVHLGRFCF
ncbi:conserved protein of unknown function [Pseudomonas marincola]|uniref:Uncharacterized protein n=1 Tax=Pseudomonas marincola TaxID=437900 RepID=A0A653DZN6_9PSED|nr:conserved protein of unknown function [Pseudomonas marincola]